ncbi:putative glycoprotein [Vibrio phage vB_VspS_VS-ABTNL-3]|nr:putative glycoprotein [Vibrio phage vB_VspS_VS-ABTNL-3]
MPVEVIGADDGVDKLNEAWPDGSEPVKQGDDHLRNIKKAVKNQERLNKESNFGISNPNLFINGDFSVWQRGYSFSAVTGQYTADRWIIGNNGGNLNVSAGYGLGAGAQSNGIAFTCTGAVNPRLNQRVEANTFRSTSATHVTISFWAHSTADGLALEWLPRSPVNVNDWSSVVDLGTHSLGTTVSNQWKFFTKTLPITDAFRMGFGGNVQISGTITGTVTFSRMKLEFGEIASEFIPEDPATTLTQCQRYYYTPVYGQPGAFIFLDTVGAPYNDLTTKLYAHHIKIFLPMSMRSAVNPAASGFTVKVGTSDVSGFYASTMDYSNNIWAIRNAAGGYVNTGDLTLRFFIDMEL